MKISHKKKYEFQTDRGSKAEITIEAKVEDVGRNDVENILHEAAICTHNFYLSLGRKITGKD